MTACVQFSTTPEKELYLIIQNEGERALNVNATISHLKTMSQKMQILEHQAKKITMSKAVGGSPFIVLNAGNGECIIDMGSLARGGNFFNHVPFVAHLTPISGAYLLFMIAVILGGTWVCCKSKKSGGHFDGVPYQELEMGQPDSFSTKNMGTEDWDEGWDNEWDEKD